MLLAYEQLGTDERAAFVLREAYALPYAEIAEILGAAVPTVRQWVSRARHRLDTDLRPSENVRTSWGVLRVAQLGVSDGLVTRIYFHSNPSKLTRLDLPEGFAASPSE